MLAASRDEGLIEEVAHQLLTGALDLTDRTHPVRDGAPRAGGVAPPDGHPGRRRGAGAVVAGTPGCWWPATGSATCWGSSTPRTSSPSPGGPPPAAAARAGPADAGDRGRHLARRRPARHAAGPDPRGAGRRRAGPTLGSRPSRTSSRPWWATSATSRTAERAGDRARRLRPAWRTISPAACSPSWRPASLAARGVEGLARLSGGASRETWSFDLRRRARAGRPLDPAAAPPRRDRVGGPPPRSRWRRTCCGWRRRHGVPVADGGGERRRHDPRHRRHGGDPARRRDHRPQAAPRRRVGHRTRAARRPGAARRWPPSTPCPVDAVDGLTTPDPLRQYTRRARRARASPTPPSSWACAGWRPTGPRRPDVGGGPRRPPRSATCWSTTTGCGRSSTGSWPTSATRSRTSAGSACGPGGSARPLPAGGVATREGLVEAYEAARADASTRGPPLVGGAGHPQVGRHLHHAGLEPPERRHPIGGAGHHRPPGLRERVGRAGPAAGGAADARRDPPSRPPGASLHDRPHARRAGGGGAGVGGRRRARRHRGAAGVPRPGGRQRPGDGGAGAGAGARALRRPTPTGSAALGCADDRGAGRPHPRR